MGGAMREEAKNRRAAGLRWRAGGGTIPAAISVCRSQFLLCLMLSTADSRDHLSSEEEIFILHERGRISQCALSTLFLSYLAVSSRLQLDQFSESMARG